MLLLLRSHVVAKTVSDQHRGLVLNRVVKKGKRYRSVKYVCGIGSGHVKAQARKDSACQVQFQDPTP